MTGENFDEFDERPVIHQSNLFLLMLFQCGLQSIRQNFRKIVMRALFIKVSSHQTFALYGIPRSFVIMHSGILQLIYFAFLHLSDCSYTCRKGDLSFYFKSFQVVATCITVLWSKKHRYLYQMHQQPNWAKKVWPMRLNQLTTDAVNKESIQFQQQNSRYPYDIW